MCCLGVSLINLSFGSEELVHVSTGCQFEELIHVSIGSLL